MEDNSDDVDGDMLSIALNSEHPVDSWILDSTCSSYMMPNRDWLDTYKLVNSCIMMYITKLLAYVILELKCLMV